MLFVDKLQSIGGYIKKIQSENSSHYHSDKHLMTLSSNNFYIYVIGSFTSINKFFLTMILDVVSGNNIFFLENFV